MNGVMDVQMDEWTHGRTDGWKDWWMNGVMDGLMDGGLCGCGYTDRLMHG